MVLPYIDDMAAAYAAADLALCRSGAMTCAELAAVGLPAIFVPLPIGNGEQRLNAEPAVAAGAALMVADAELDGRLGGRARCRALRGARPDRADARGRRRVAGQPDAAAALVPWWLRRIAMRPGAIDPRP